MTLLGLPFEVTVADVAEDPLADETPAATVVRLSQAKARAACPDGGQDVCGDFSAGPCPLLVMKREAKALRLHPEALRLKPKRGRPVRVIVACDTIVALDGEILGKPRNPGEAKSMLRRLRGGSHAVYSAVTLLDPVTGGATTEVAETQLVMRTYTNAEIDAYVASGDPLDKAGAYAIQHPGFHPVAKLHGCYANVVGLPLCHLTRCLRAFDIEPSRDVPAACQAHTGRHCPVYAAILRPPKSDE